MSVTPYQAKEGQVVTVSQTGGQAHVIGGHVIITEQPKLPYVAAPQNIREWDTGLCDCTMDCAYCAFVMFCCVCAQCQVAGRLKEHCCVACGLSSAGLIAMRTKFRTQYGIRGNICADCCVATYCGPCAICQMDREMKSIGI